MEIVRSGIVLDGNCPGGICLSVGGIVQGGNCIGGSCVGYLFF